MVVWNEERRLGGRLGDKKGHASQFQPPSASCSRRSWPANASFGSLKYAPMPRIRPFLHGETEPCINGRILAIGSYFKEPNDALANRLLGEQLADGGWNCKAPPSRRSSFHTTICVLEGLLEYERAGRPSAAVTKARKRAENYLLERRMFRSLRTGEVIDRRWLRFSYPTFWHYDVLRGLDYLRNVGIKPDSRVSEAIDIVIARRHQNGRWPLNLLHPERIPLEMETAVAGASRWNTLRALRVLRWYGQSTW